MSRTAWVSKEPINYVVGANLQKQTRIHAKIKKQNLAIDNEWLEKRKQWVFIPASNQNIVLHQDAGAVPAGLTLSVPHEIGCLILHKRLGRIRESPDVKPDAVIDGDIEDAVEAMEL